MCQRACPAHAAVSLKDNAQGVLLSFVEDQDLESDYRAECASESYSADCGLYMLAFSLWVLIWHTLYSAGDWRHAWSAANAVMCFCTLLGMRYGDSKAFTYPTCMLDLKLGLAFCAWW